MGYNKKNSGKIIMTNCKHHPDYTNELPRLNKIAGQINGIKKMIEERRYCPDIIIQLQAISSACKSVEAILLENHLESCVLGAFNADNKEEQDIKIKELTNLYKK